jgi:anthranilate phosphoribosyltransferase
LEALGVKTDLSAERTTACVETAGVGFLFAPSYHPGMARVGPVRRQLAVRTIFNLLGPLVNPARATHQLIGVYSTSLVRPLAEALMALGSRRAMVVSSDDGLDEISLSGRTQMAILHNGRVRVEAITPEAVGLRVRPSSALAGGDAKTNARIMRDILLGKKGAPREVSALNAAAALIVAGLARNWKEGLSLAFDSIDSGRAKKSLDALIEMTRGQ